MIYLAENLTGLGYYGTVTRDIVSRIVRSGCSLGENKKRSKQAPSPGGCISVLSIGL